MLGPDALGAGALLDEVAIAVADAVADGVGELGESHATAMSIRVASGHLISGERIPYAQGDGFSSPRQRWG